MFRTTRYLVRHYSNGLPKPHTNPKLLQTKLFINNEWTDAQGGKTFKTINPTTENVITEIQYADKEDVEKAVKAAKDAFKLGSEWRRMDASARGKLILRLGDLIERDSAYLASLETLECGKLYTSNFRNDLPWAIRSYHYYGGYADKIEGRVVSINGPFSTYTRHEPVGVCALITAWNFSVVLIAWKLAPALAAGCTVVVKPSQHSTLAGLHIAELSKEAGFPPGVINFLAGPSDVGQHLIEHPDIDKISFTGSTEVGKHIYRESANYIKRLTLELGGKSPNIILPDANIDKAVEHAHFATFQNMGQCCCAGSRTFVHESIYDEFLQKSIQRIKKKKIGNPFDFDVEHGPQTTKEQMEFILKMVETGKQEGAKLEIGGNRIGTNGYFVEPTLFSNVEDDMDIAKLEIFGPVQQIFKYKTIDEVIERANNTDYGLAASIFGTNINDINTIAHNVRAGSIWVNCYFMIEPQAPFGGFKQSGIGREGGEYGISNFTEVKSVFIKTPSLK